MRDRNEPKTVFALEMRLRMSYLSERDDEIMDPRYVKDDLKVACVPLERVIGSVFSVELSVSLLCV